MKRQGVTKTLVGFCAVLLALVSAGCDGFGDYCEARMDCENGNDADIDACELQFDYQEDLSSLYGCDEFFVAMVECLEERSQCDTDTDPPTYTSNDDCSAEQLDHSSCMGE